MAQPIHQLVQKMLRQRSLAAGLRRGSVLAAWPEVAGQTLAAMTQAQQLEDGVLWIRVPDAVAAHQLTYNRQVFLDRLQAQFPGQVTDLRFQVGSLPRSQPVERLVALPPLDPAEQDQLLQLTHDLPPELHPVVLRAGQRVLQAQKRQTQPPCQLCQRSCQGQQPCPHCARLLADPAVRREAQRLVHRPQRRQLEEDALRAARHLAGQTLLEQMDQLLPQVVRQPELLPLLQDQARRYLCLLEQPTALGLLPQRVRYLLKSL